MPVTPLPGAAVAPLPAARGPLSEFLLEHLAREPHPVPHGPPLPGSLLTDHDAQLALYCCYELHYRPMAGVDPTWEWEPSLITFRRRIEERFLDELRDLVLPACTGAPIAQRLQQLVDGGGGPSLSAMVLEHGTLEHVREFAVHRSAYQLKEADCHSWALPRLSGRPKAALVEIQMDEYGNGVELDMHSSLFAVTMDALGLDARYGAYLDLLPGTTLATTNLISLFGLHRRLRGALVGHLALFEMTSVVPMQRYSDALARLGVDQAAQRFYDAHVLADAHHSVVARDHLAAALAAQEPELERDIEFGAIAVSEIERRFAQRLLDSWADGRTSLLSPLP
jgi:hypothetical protein